MTEKKTNRIIIRISDSDKLLLNNGARLSNVALAEFVRSAAIYEAEKVINGTITRGIFNYFRKDSNA